MNKTERLGKIAKVYPTVHPFATAPSESIAPAGCVAVRPDLIKEARSRYAQTGASIIFRLAQLGMNRATPGDKYFPATCKDRTPTGITEKRRNN